MGDDGRWDDGRVKDQYVIQLDVHRPQLHCQLERQDKEQRGPLSEVSPMTIHVHLTFNRNHVTLNGREVEIIAGKEWGVTGTSNKNSLLNGEK